MFSLYNENRVLSQMREITLLYVLYEGRDVLFTAAVSQYKTPLERMGAARY